MNLPISNSKNNQLLFVNQTLEHDLSDIFLSLMIAFYRDKTVLVYNNWRQAWEIPGGRVDDGETPRQAAIRELAEESGQHAANVQFVAEIVIAEEAKDRRIRAALFSCDLLTRRPFEANEEIGAIRLWSPSQDQPFDAIDEALISLVYR